MRKKHMVTAQTHEAATATYRRELGDSLVLRWSTAADTANIAELVGRVFRDKESDPPNVHMASEVHELMSDKHPLMGSGDYGVVEDTRKEGNPLVACTCLWRNRWEYEGIPFEMGQPEIVATDPNYRNKGLIRALFEMVHARSESEGHMVQAITGISHFYRQFGYEYALDLDGKRVVSTAQIPKAKEGESEAYTLRSATAEDVTTIQQLYNARKVGVITSDVPDAYWLYLCEIHTSGNKEQRFPRLLMIVDTQGKACGYARVAADRYRPGNNYTVYTLETLPEINLRAMMPSVLRELQRYSSQLPIRYTTEWIPLSQISLSLGRTHPVYDALGNLAPVYKPPYAWYVRVRDVPAFLRHIAPVLERRLEHSVVANYTGELKIDLYRSGLRMVFEHGKLVTAEHWRNSVYDSTAGAGFPPLVFLQLLFCHRSFDELRYAFPDVWVEEDTEVVLKALFPAQMSAPLPL